MAFTRMLRLLLVLGLPCTVAVNAEDDAGDVVYNSDVAEVAAEIETLPNRIFVHTLSFKDRRRIYLSYVPELDQGESRPLLLLLHGGRAEDDPHLDLSDVEFCSLAEKERVIVVWAKAVGGGAFDPIGYYNGDLGYIRKVVSDVCTTHSVDRSRVFAAGWSAGAIMCHRLAAEASETFAAVVPVIATMPSWLSDNREPTHPVSMFTIIGDEDRHFPVTGRRERPRANGRFAQIGLLSLDDQLDWYARLNVIDGSPSRATLPDRNKADGTTVETITYPPGRTGFRIQCWIVNGGAHQYHGSKGVQGNARSRTNKDFSFPQAAWTFLKDCPPRRIAE